MLKLKVISVGKTKEEWLDHALKEYVKRLKSYLSIEFIWVKNDEQLQSLVDKEPLVICLDASGLAFSSEEFSSFILSKFNEGGSRLTMVIGGPDGLPATVKKKFPLISLSSLTMTHQIVRLVLLEQIYRAFEIAKGSKYHRA